MTQECGRKSSWHKKLVKADVWNEEKPFGILGEPCLLQHSLSLPVDPSGQSLIHLFICPSTAQQVIYLHQMSCRLRTQYLHLFKGVLLCQHRSTSRNVKTIKTVAGILRNTQIGQNGQTKPT